MEYTSFYEITENYHFLKRVVENLEEDNFQFMTIDEIRELKQEIVNELSLDTSFKHLAMFEAKLRTGYNVVLSVQKKDVLSRAYMDLCRKHRARLRNYDVPLDKLCRKVKFEHLLGVVQKYFKEIGAPIHRDCSVVKGHLKFRHWYAHGRYSQHVAPVPDPENLEYVCDEIVSAVANRV